MMRLIRLLCECFTTPKRPTCAEEELKRDTAANLFMEVITDGAVYGSILKVFTGTRADRIVTKSLYKQRKLIKIKHN